MTNILLCGCNGKMGRAVTACAATRDDCQIVAGIDLNTAATAGYPVFADPASCTVDADVIVDFSHPSCLSDVLSLAVARGIPAVICTTGLSDDQIAQIHETARTVPMFFSANMSLGVSLLAELCKKAATVLGNSFDVEIIERHHNQKLDAPSGTALMLAEAVRDGLTYEPNYVFDRHAVRQKRDPHEIGFSAVRGGTIVGEHEVLFAGHEECLSLIHRAQSKEVFAAGALNAALFMKAQPTGLYSMKELVAQA
ncbi:MAG: 4-hydroxy-tetrahydrodipicolinate reductase [Clostridia bacterium]|nr:4-hydroxy-tetrahydrodipicolinate reductase [Clostridia bacterium]